MVRDDCDIAPATIEVADSWLVEEGMVRALDLHRARFMTSIPRHRARDLDLEAFWDAAIAATPRTGAWFPRVELREQLESHHLLFRLREAPTLARSVTLTTYAGRDPRTAPTVKGPDLGAMIRLRTDAQTRGADEAVLLTEEGWIAEGSTTSLAWWRGETLCIPARDIPRIDSVTLRSALAVATAMGVEVVEEHATPDDLEGLEVWALNALHGIRIAVAWQDGPLTAEEPGRLSRWRLMLDALRRELPEVSA